MAGDSSYCTESVRTEDGLSCRSLSSVERPATRATFDRTATRAGRPLSGRPARSPHASRVAPVRSLPLARSEDSLLSSSRSPDTSGATEIVAPLVRASNVVDRLQINGVSQHLRIRRVGMQGASPEGEGGRRKHWNGASKTSGVKRAARPPSRPGWGLARVSIRRETDVELLRVDRSDRRLTNREYGPFRHSILNPACHLSTPASSFTSSIFATSFTARLAVSAARFSPSVRNSPVSRLAKTLQTALARRP